MNNLLDSILERQSNGPRIIHEEHDTNKINVRAALLDEAELGKIDAATRQRLLERQQETLIKLANVRANYNVRNGKVSVMAVGEVPWSGLGITIDRAANSKEACVFGNLDGWMLEKIPQVVVINGKEVKTGSYAIVRMDTSDVLTYGKSVGERYHVFSNEECFDFMDAVIEGGAQYETAGALGKGEIVWMLAKFPENISIKGDTLEKYIMFGTSHDGSSAIWCYPTSVRTVCQNTYRLSFKDRKKGVSIRHTKNAKDKIKQVQNALGLSQKEFKRFEEMGNHLAEKQLPKPDLYFENVLDTVMDVTVAGQKLNRENITDGTILETILEIKDAEDRSKAEKSYNRALKKRENILEEIITRYETERNNGDSRFTGTAWAAVNAMTEYADHSDSISYHGDDRQKAESRFLSVMDGKTLEFQEVAIQQALKV